MAPDRSSFLPSTRESALLRLEEFLPSAAEYAERRNHVERGHGNVSRLSPATRTRLVLESELIEAARERFPGNRIEKFEQEVWWRLYWKGWLEMRPGVWAHYRKDLKDLEWSERALEVANGNSGVAIMDSFAKELMESGYLHNHARMWWAAFWIHVEKLPWQLGADFFLRHLCDGDPASNTLSWRWVAGLHTKGKSYLVRRSNLERYLEGDILREHGKGLERLEHGSPIPVSPGDPPSPQSLSFEDVADLSGRFGIWIHEEDLLIENSPLSDLRPSVVGAFRSTGIWNQEMYSPGRQAFLEEALPDGLMRATEHFDCASVLALSDDLADSLADWASERQLSTVVAMQPFVGPLADEMFSVRERLNQCGIELSLVRRPEDVSVMNKATAGFFGFWKKTKEDRAALT